MSKELIRLTNARIDNLREVVETLVDTVNKLSRNQERLKRILLGESP